MKFSLLTPAKNLGPRLGILKDFQNNPNLQLETPMLLLHTQGGQVPHLTHEVFKLVSSTHHALQIPLVNMHIFKEVLENYDGAVAEFIGSKNSVTCLTLQDPREASIQGHHLKDKIPVCTRQGKILYDVDTYMKAVESFQPDMYYLLSDADTNSSSPQKRVVKSVENTISLNKQCMERHKNSEILKKLFVMAPVTGGYCLKAREKCVNFLKEHEDFGGYLIDGLHNNGPDVELIRFSDISEVVQFVIKSLSQDRLFSVQGCWNPAAVLKLVCLGIDVFDTSYCQIVTERSYALTFSIEKGEDSCTNEINLLDAKYAEDFTPIISTCLCLTCLKYTRSYIHHLLTVHELLAPVLLMIHNMHHYLRYFKYIRKCITDDSIGDLDRRITEQYKKHLDLC